MIDAMYTIEAGVFLVVDDGARVIIFIEPSTRHYGLGTPHNVNTFPTKQEALDYITLNNLIYENIY